MTQHPGFDDLIEIHHQPDGATSRRWAAHIDGCPHCREVLAGMRVLSKEMARPVNPPSKEKVFRAKSVFLNEALDPKRSAGINRFLRTFLRPAPAIALAALVAVLIVRGWMGGGDPAGTQLSTRQAGDVVSARPLAGIALETEGEAHLISRDGLSRPIDGASRLSPGVTVRMAPDARVRLRLRQGADLSLYGASARLVRADYRDIHVDLRAGRLTASVRPLGDGQSFVASTPDLEVRVRGTRFTVSYAPDEGTRVSVSHGEVLVVPHDPEKERHVLRPGESFASAAAGTTGGRLVQQPIVEAASKPETLGPGTETAAPAVTAIEPAPYKGRRVARAIGHQASVRPDPDLPARMLETARIAQRERRFDDAVAHLDVLLGRYPAAREAEDAFYLKGENLLATGRVQAAARIFEEAARRLTRPGLRENALYTLGYLLQNRLDKPEAARSVWMRYLDQFPSGTLREEAGFALCQNTAKSSDHSRALRTCTQFSIRYPQGYQTPQAVLYAANAAFRLGRHRQAAELYGRYIKSGRADYRGVALYRRGLSLLKTDRPDAAVPAFRRFLALYPNHSKASEVRGILIGLGE